MEGREKLTIGAAGCADTLATSILLYACPHILGTSRRPHLLNARRSRWGQRK